MLDMSELFDVVGMPEHVPDPDNDIVHRLRFDDSLEVPINLTDDEVWLNYANDDLYALDVKVREFLRKTRYRREKKDGMRVTASLVFRWIYGRKPTPSDAKAFKLLHILLKYYCTSFTGKTTFAGKRVSRAYRFSKYSGQKKRPYSLRLRLEEAKPGDAVWRANPGVDEDKRTYRRCNDRAVSKPSDGRSGDGQ